MCGAYFEKIILFVYMKKSLLFLLAVLMSCGMGSAQNYKNASEPDKMWGNYCYREQANGAVYDAQTSERAMTTMPPLDGMILAYYYRIPQGHVKADVVWQNVYARLATVNVRVIYPHTGQVLYEGSFGNTDISSKQRTDVLFPDINFPADDFYRIELTCEHWNYLKTLDYFNYYRENELPVLIPRNFGGTSAFMSPFTSTHPDAPEGNAYDWIYLEARVNKGHNYQGTYYMTVGTPTGYMGMQTNGRIGDDDFERNVLFSIWDAQNMDEDPNLAEYLQSKVIDGNLDAVHTHAGGEGSSASVMFQSDRKWWRDDHWIQFLVNSRPMTTPVTVKDRNGKDSTFNYGYTVTSAWYKVDTMPEWRYMASIRAAGICRNFGGWYDFIEPFTSAAGQKMHTVYHRHPAMRSAASGKWYNCNRLVHGYDDNGDKDRRYHLDFGRGATQMYDNCFRLDMGGYVHQHDSAEVVPLAKDMSFVDTIDLDRLNRRVEQALARDDYYNTNELINSAAATVTAWRVLDKYTSTPNSARNVIDGNKETNWYTSTYPAYLALEADEVQTFSSFELYWKSQYSTRAHFVDIYTSADGEQWELAYDSVEVRCLDRIEVTLPQPLKTKYLRMKFHHKYTSNQSLSINEITMRGEFDLDKTKAIAKQLIDNAGSINNYPLADLQEVIAVYDNGACTDAQALATALQEVSRKSSFTRNYLVADRINLSQEHAYYVQNANGYGVLAATTEGRLTAKGATVEGSLSDYTGRADMDDPYNNWQVLHDEPYSAYYLYNIGARKFLNTNAEGGLSDEPQPLTVRPWGKTFYFTVEATKEIVGIDTGTDKPLSLQERANNYTYFYLYDNFRQIQPVGVADSLRQYTEPIDKLALYKAGIEQMLDAPVGVVGGFASQEAREALQSAYDNADTNPQAFIEAVENVDIIELDPEGSVYRFISTAEALQSTPYITADEGLRIYAKADSKGSDQIWRFQQRNDGYTLSSQGVSIKPMGNRTGETMVATANYDNCGTFVLSEPSWGKHYIGATEFADAVVNGTSSPMKSAAPNAVGSTWFVEPATTTSLSLNSVGATSIYFDYAVILPADVRAYGVSSVNSDGVLQLVELGDTVPARTAAILLGDVYQKVELGVRGSVPAKETDNLLKGVYFRNTSMQKGTFMTLTTANGKPVMKKPVIAVVSANQVYLPITDEMPKLDTYTIDSGVLDAVGSVAGDSRDDDNDSAAYTLDGIKAVNTVKGNIYIKNHKKVLTK